jgi:hypothetical protein
MVDTIVFIDECAFRSWNVFLFIDLTLPRQGDCVKSGKGRMGEVSMPTTAAALPSLRNPTTPSIWVGGALGRQALRIGDRERRRHWQPSSSV